MTSDEDVTYRFRLSLRLRHPRENLALLSSVLGLEPSRIWTVGDPRATPKGQPLDGKWDSSYSTMPIDVEHDDSIQAALQRVASILALHTLPLKQHISSGGTVEIFVGYFQESFNSGFLLPAGLMREYASLGVSIDFDIYGQSDVPDKP